MPFVSQAQSRWMFLNKPAMAREWASKTPSIKGLPKRIKHRAYSHGAIQVAMAMRKK